MKTLAVSAVKSNNSYVHFAGENQKSTRRRAIGITLGTLAVAGVGVVAYRNSSRIIQFASDLRVNAKYFYLNTIKLFGN